MADAYHLINPQVRANAMEAVRNAPANWVVTIKEPTRRTVQNNMLHALLEDMARSGFKWDGEARTALEWKNLCVSGHTIATGLPAKFTRGLEGELLNVRESTANMGVARASSLISYVIAFCDMNAIPLTRTRNGGFEELLNRTGK